MEDGRGGVPQVVKEGDVIDWVGGLHMQGFSPSSGLLCINDVNKKGALNNWKQVMIKY